MRRFVTVIVFLAVGATPAAMAQHSEDPDSAKSHGRTFSTGPREGWTFSSPHIDIGGGVYMEPGHDPKISEGFFRVHVQVAVGPKLLELSTDLLWLPAFSARPTLSAVLQVAPLPEHAPFYVAAGGGLITGSTDRFAGWLQAELAVRTPIHELTPFISVGKALVADSELELQIGIAHPLAPYLLHFP